MVEPLTAETRGTCQCDACRRDGIHSADCAVHNEPAYPRGRCNCGLEIGNIRREANEILNGRGGHGK